jgi:hypothetical protein
VSAGLGGGPFPVMGTADPLGMSDAAVLINDAIQRFQVSAGGPRGETVAAEMAAACGLASHGLARLAAGQGVELPVSPPGSLPEAIEAQRSAWLLSSRPGGLDDSIAKLPV